MKKILQLVALALITVSVSAQNASRLPAGFRKAVVPAAQKNKVLQISPKQKIANEGVPTSTSPNFRVPAPSTQVHTSLIDETVLCNTFYDLQTNSGISNRLVKNADGTIAAAWTTCNAYDNAQAFPDRGTGYSYFDGTSWGPSNPTCLRVESVRTGFTNVVNTSTGSEFLVAHGTDAMTLTYRPTKGTGAWTTSYPWGATTNDTWAKAIAGGNNLAYAIFQGSGVNTPPVPLFGQVGPLLFSKSTDGGVTWSVKSVIPGTDSTLYHGFGGDEYSIDARGDTIAIVLGSTLTDLMLLKSVDAGSNWTKTVIYQSPLPGYDISIPEVSDTNSDGIIDTLMSHAGDATVLIDNNGMCHVWFSDMRWLNDGSTPDTYSYFPGTDGLEYWNETMPTGGFVLIAGAEDLNGNGVLDVPSTSTTCNLDWGDYRGGLTGMPSAGVDGSNIIYCSYQTINELADTTLYLQAHRHVYVIASTDGGQTWTTPYNIVPMIADGGDGEIQEAAFASMAKRVDNNEICILYQRDAAPGYALADAARCDHDNNAGNASDIVFARINAATMVGISSVKKDDLFVGDVYPNPTTGMTYMKITPKVSGDVIINVTDVLGRVVYSEIKQNVPSGLNNISVNTSEWNSGLYNYTVITGSQKASRQIVVQ